MSPWCSLRVLLATLSLAACSSAPSRADAGDLSDAGEDGAQPADAQPASDASDGAIDKAANCASTFGNAIGSVGFARFDGTYRKGAADDAALAAVGDVLASRRS